MSQGPTESHSRVVIVGAGFGGLTVAKRLANTPLDVTVVDQHNYHLFQPLLYQVATSSLSPADIASPIRGILRNVDFRPYTRTGDDGLKIESMTVERRITSRHGFDSRPLSE